MKKVEEKFGYFLSSDTQEGDSAVEENQSRPTKNILSLDDACTFGIMYKPRRIFKITPRFEYGGLDANRFLKVHNA